MIKKIGLSMLLLFVIFCFGASFANPIAPSDYRRIPNICYKLKNVEIDNYRVIIEHGGGNGSYYRVLANTDREVYEAAKNECTKCSARGSSKVYLLDKNIDIKEITHENIKDKAIFVGEIYNSDCASHYDKINSYKIANNGGNYEIIQINTKDLEKIRKFPLLWFFAVLIETLVLFFVAKIFRKKDEIVEEIGYEKNEISNKKLFLRGVIPTTITLPLLWFVLPLIMGDGVLYVIVGETLVASIEAVMIKYGLNISRKRAIIASVICNMFSFVILLFYSLLNGQSYLIKTIIRAIIWLLVFIMLEGIILFFVGKFSKEQISNKRLILGGLLIPVLDFLLCLFVIWVFDDILNIHSDLPSIITVIISKVLLDIFVIKGLWKISLKRAVLAGVLCNLYLVAIILALIYLINN